MHPQGLVTGCGLGWSLAWSLQGLADESEFVRETSLQAGQTVVNRYADTAVELFLPQLESGLFDENWRIRYSGSITLTPSLKPMWARVRNGESMSNTVHDQCPIQLQLYTASVFSNGVLVTLQFRLTNGTDYGTLPCCHMHVAL